MSLVHSGGQSKLKALVPVQNYFGLRLSIPLKKRLRSLSLYSSQKENNEYVCCRVLSKHTKKVSYLSKPYHTFFSISDTRFKKDFLLRKKVNAKE